MQTFVSLVYNIFNITYHIIFGVVVNISIISITGKLRTLFGCGTTEEEIRKLVKKAKEH